jgi:hypothetical protein
MRFILLSAVLAVALPAFPATAQDGSPAPGGWSAVLLSAVHAPDVRIHRGHDGRRGDGDRRDRRRFRDRHGDTFFAYRDYQGDTLWRSDSFNDWWHDRPDRAFPRWVAGNAKCERLWWSGSGWRC